jgi:hypothetical protein
MGSSLRLPIGYLYLSWLAIIQEVKKTIAVLKKSRAASTKLAMTDNEDVMIVTMIFRTRRIVFAIRLMRIANFTIGL